MIKFKYLYIKNDPKMIVRHFVNTPLRKKAGSTFGRKRVWIKLQAGSTKPSHLRAIYTSVKTRSDDISNKNFLKEAKMVTPELNKF